MLNIQHPREHQSLITFVSIHPVKSCLAILFHNRVIYSCATSWTYLSGNRLCKSVSRLRIRFILKSVRFRGYVVNEKQYISIGSIFQRFKIRLNIAVKQACFNHKEGIRLF